MSRTILSLVLIVSITLPGCAAFARGTDDDSNVDNRWVVAQRRSDARRAAEAREQWLAQQADRAPTDALQ